jgi:hypothetical protein
MVLILGFEYLEHAELTSNCWKFAERVWYGCILARRNSQKKKTQFLLVQMNTRHFHLCLGKSERPDHMSLLTWPFFSWLCRRAQSSGPKLKLMTGRKCQNFRLFGCSQESVIFHIEYRITCARQWNTILLIYNKVALISKYKILNIDKQI